MPTCMHHNCHLPKSRVSDSHAPHKCGAPLIWECGACANQKPLTWECGACESETLDLGRCIIADVLTREFTVRFSNITCHNVMWLDHARGIMKHRLQQMLLRFSTAA